VPGEGGFRETVTGGVGPFGLLVMASGDLREHTAVFFRVLRLLHEYTVLMCTDLSRYRN
jgi:beta-fructofuranosidase